MRPDERRRGWSRRRDLLLLHGLALVACLPGAALGIVHHVRTAEYTTNSVCIKKNCINPVFPAMRKFGKSVLSTNQNKTWTCAEKREAWQQAGMCRQVVAGYHFALPVPTDGDDEATEEQLVRKQAQEAVEAYVAHVSGLGRDFWVLTEPWKHDECIQAVWRMACMTYFPRCNQLDRGAYLRPCESSCQNYVSACKVTCCDEGVQCVFSHQMQSHDGSVEVEEGYVNHAGPSLLCTGGAAPTRKLQFGVGVAALLAVVLGQLTWAT